MRVHNLTYAMFFLIPSHRLCRATHAQLPQIVQPRQSDWDSRDSRSDKDGIFEVSEETDHTACHTWQDSKVKRWKVKVIRSCSLLTAKAPQVNQRWSYRLQTWYNLRPTCIFWNLLPESVRKSTSIVIVKCSLKTFLFEQITHSAHQRRLNFRLIQVYFLILILQISSVGDTVCDSVSRSLNHWHQNRNIAEMTLPASN